jgi:tetratricopeptide (TPR) repeat protein
MAADRIGAQIEARIRKEQWKPAQALIERQLAREPDDHWLWARLSGVKYEQRDYQGALEAADRARAIVPDCPLALWSYAGAIEVLGKPDEAMAWYTKLFRRGLEQLKDPDADATECWEGPDWTSALMADCLFRIAGCLAKTGQRDNAIKLYQALLSLLDLVQGIYSREDVRERLNKLVPSKKARREAVVKLLEQEDELIPS